MDNNFDISYANHKILGTYGWIASTYWYHQRYFKSNRNALNLAFFAGGSFIASYTLAASLHPQSKHNAYN